MTGWVNYLLFDNAVSSTVGSLAGGTRNLMVKHVLGLEPNMGKQIPPILLSKLVAETGPYLRIAGLSGAAAVIIGAYGTHNGKEYFGDDEKSKEIFKIANNYHLVHSLALLSMPLCKQRFLATTFMISGVVLFSGSVYYNVFTKTKKLSKFTPIGGMCFILGWLCLCL